MLRRYVEQLLSIYNFIDGIMITDKMGYVEYYQTFRPDVNNLKEKDVLHKHVTDVYPGLDEKSSSIMRVLRTGQPIYNEYQTLMTYKGHSIRAINSTMPIKNNDEIIGAVDVSRYVDSPYERQNITIKPKKNISIKSLYTLDDIITSSQSMELIKERIPMVADTDSSVMIYGETGTGKELVAQSIHTCSKRRNKRFISQNCAAIPGNLLESILFGTTKGSYTGAENKPGLFEIANGGTLFLDEINSMGISVQSKILKAIEEKQVVRLGGYEPIKTDVKIISAVNEPPLQCVDAGKLREDLFYRLSVVQLNIPPLRERINDLFFLISHFIDTYNMNMNKNILGVESDVEELFSNYSWPGNVREVKNVIEGAFNIASNRFIQLKDIPVYLINATTVSDNCYTARPSFKSLDNGITLDMAMAQYEKALIEEAVMASKSLVEAAKRLGITKQSLNYKLLKYNIEKG
jgi:arginine utilization regulatory protein